MLADGPWDAVFHFAGLIEVGASMREPFRYLLDNAMLGTRLIDACVRHGVRRFVLSSTAAVYGVTAVSPIVEDAPIDPAAVDILHHIDRPAARQLTGVEKARDIRMDQAREDRRSRRNRSTSASLVAACMTLIATRAGSSSSSRTPRYTVPSRRCRGCARCCMADREGDLARRRKSVTASSRHCPVCRSGRVGEQRFHVAFQNHAARRTPPEPPAAVPRGSRPGPAPTPLLREPNAEGHPASGYRISGHITLEKDFRKANRTRARPP